MAFFFINELARLRLPVMIAAWFWFDVEMASSAYKTLRFHTKAVRQVCRGVLLPPTAVNC